jgi:hypothetical protein
MRYMPADVRYPGAEWRRAHYIYLLQGEDRTDGFNTYTPVPEF